MRRRDHLPALGPPRSSTRPTSNVLITSTAGSGRMEVSWALFLNPSWARGPGAACMPQSCLDPSVRSAPRSRSVFGPETKDRMWRGYTGFRQVWSTTRCAGHVARHPADLLLRMSHRCTLSATFCNFLLKTWTR